MLTCRSIRDGTAKSRIIEKSCNSMLKRMFSERNASETEKRKYSNQSPCECPSVHAVQYIHASSQGGSVMHVKCNLHVITRECC